MATRTEARPLNRVVEWDPYSSKFEVFHADDRGDVHELQFRLAKGIFETDPVTGGYKNERRIELEYSAQIWRWLAYKVQQGFQPDESTIQTWPPTPCTEFDHLDEVICAVTCRFKVVRPKVLKVDEIQPYVEAQPDRHGSLKARLAERQVALTPPAVIEQNARQQRAAQQKAPIARKSWDEMEAQRRAAGLPTVDPDESVEEFFSHDEFKPVAPDA